MECVGCKAASEIEAVLIDLCVQYGYCLSSKKRETIVTHPPTDAESFVDEVLRAEGVSDDSLSRDDRKALTDMVDQRLFTG